MYFRIVIAVLLIWLASIAFYSEWHLLIDQWEIPLTMAFGSFVAGFSAEGGGAVAFPVFTKLLNIAPVDAKQFSLLIQSVGMTMAAIFIFLRKIPFYSTAIFPAILGGALGQIITVSMGWFVGGDHIKWLFTIHIAALGLALILQHYFGIKRSEIINKKVSNPLLFFAGILGGFLTINIGCGADMVAFIMLTLVLSSTEKKATPTTVIIMALNSIIGVILISITSEWSTWAVNAWKTAIPVVIFGAPLGAYLASKVSNLFILNALLFFILIEVVSTIYIVPFQSWVIPMFLFILFVMCSLIWRKHRNIKVS